MKKTDYLNEKNNQTIRGRLNFNQQAVYDHNEIVSAKRKKWSDDAAIRYPNKLALIIERANNSKTLSQMNPK